MTATVQTSFIELSQNTHAMLSRGKKPIGEELIYNVEITDYDNEMQFLEVCASSVAEAAEIAQSIACCDIYMINIYEYVGY